MLEKLPDFSMDLHFKCGSSYIPFISSLAPSDTYKIYKSGSNLRLDMTLIGFRKLQSIRGNKSVLLKGRDCGQNRGEMLLVDHEAKTVNSIFEDTVGSKVQKDLEGIMSDEQLHKKFKPETFKISPVLERNKRPKTKVIEGMTAEKYKIKTVYSMTKFKFNTNKEGKLYAGHSYDDYTRLFKVDITHDD